MPELIVVNIATYTVYDTIKDNETKEELLERANLAKQEEIACWTKNCKEYPETESFQTYLKQAKETEYKIMTWDEFEKGQRDYLLHDKIKEITEDEYNEMLNMG